MKKNIPGKLDRFVSFVKNISNKDTEGFLNTLLNAYMDEENPIRDFVFMYYENILITLGPKDSNIAKRAFNFYWFYYKDPENTHPIKAYKTALSYIKYFDDEEILKKVFDDMEKTKIFYEDFQIAQFQIQGLREKQEDAFSFKVFSHRDHLEENEWKEILNNSFIEANEIFSDPGIEAGSTAITTLVLHDRIITSNIGDSRAYYLKITIEEGVPNIQLERLHTLHNFNNLAEKNRVEKEGGYFINGRLVGKNSDITRSIAMTRAIGDNFYKNQGISNAPELFTKLITTEYGQFIILCSDGITEPVDVLNGNEKSNNNDIGYITDTITSLVNDNVDFQEWPERFARKAFLCESRDNITFIIMPVKKSENPDQHQPKLLCVFDGHTGDEVSFGLNNNFIGIFEERMIDKIQAKSSKAALKSSHMTYSPKSVAATKLKLEENPVLKPSHRRTQSSPR